SVGGIIGRKTKVRHGSVANLSCRDPVKFIGTEWFIRVHQAVDTVVIKIQIAGQRVEGKACGVAQALGNSSQVRSNDIGSIVDEGELVDGFALERTGGAGYLGAADAGGSGCLREILVRTELKKQVAASGLSGGRSEVHCGVWMLPISRGVIHID